MPILDQFGREIRKKQLPERRPLAATPVLDTWRDYVSAGLTPQKLSALLKEADAGDVRRQAELFDQMEEKDAHLLGESSKRRNAILDVPFEVRPATEKDPRDAKVAEFVDEALGGMTDWEDVLVALQDGVGKGFSALEINWDVSGGQAVPAGLEFIEQKRFLFMDRSGYFLRTPKLLTDDEPMGIEIPAWKVMLHRYGGKSGHPARSGIYRVCTWMYLFKNYALKDWVAFLEVFGMPLRLGKYDAGASKDDKDALVTAIQSLGSDAAGIISKSTEIEFIEAVKGRMGDNPFQALAEFCSKEMSKALLGQTLTADVGKTGSYAASKTHNEVRLDLAKADTKAVSATVRYQLIRPMVGFNFGWDTPIPAYEPVWEEQEGLKEKADWVTMLADRGAPIPVSFIRQQFNIPEPDEGEEVLGPKGPAGFASMKRIAAKTAQERFSDENVDKLSSQGAQEAEAAISRLLEPVLEMIEGAKSLEEIGEKIYGLYPDLASDDFQELLARAVFAAGLTGYAAAEGDSG